MRNRPKKSARLICVMPDSDKSIIEQASLAIELSMSEFCRRVAVREAKRIARRRQLPAGSAESQPIAHVV